MELYLLRWILTLIIAFILGKLIARLKMPTILGWLIAGMLLGPHALGLMPQSVIDTAWYKTIITWMQCAFGLMLGTELIWKKIKSLWFPLVGYGIVFMLLHNLFFRAHFYNPLTSHLYTRQDYFDCLKYFCSCVTPEQLLGALWFLRSLFIVSFLFMIGVWISKRLSDRYSDIILGGDFVRSGPLFCF